MSVRPLAVALVALFAVAASPPVGAEPLTLVITAEGLERRCGAARIADTDLIVTAQHCLLRAGTDARAEVRSARGARVPVVGVVADGGRADVALLRADPSACRAEDGDACDPSLVPRGFAWVKAVPDPGAEVTIPPPPHLRAAGEREIQAAVRYAGAGEPERGSAALAGPSVQVGALLGEGWSGSAVLGCAARVREGACEPGLIGVAAAVSFSGLSADRTGQSDVVLVDALRIGDPASLADEPSMSLGGWNRARGALATARGVRYAIPSAIVHSMAESCPEGAERDLRLAIRDAARDRQPYAEAWFRLANCMSARASGRRSAAEAGLRGARSPSQLAAARAEAREALELYDEVLEAYGRALELEPHPDSAFAAGLAAFNAGLLADQLDGGDGASGEWIARARRSFTRALELRDDLGRAIVLRGRIELAGATSRDELVAAYRATRKRLDAACPRYVDEHRSFVEGVLIGFVQKRWRALGS